MRNCKTKTKIKDKNADGVFKTVDDFVAKMKSLGFETIYLVYGNSKSKIAGGYLNGDTGDMVEMLSGMFSHYENYADIHKGVCRMLENPNNTNVINSVDADIAKMLNGFSNEA